MAAPMPTLPLDSRQASIARTLLESGAVASVDQVASALGLTDRMVRYDLTSVEAYLADRGLRVIRRRGVGIWIEGEDAARAAVREELAMSPGLAVLDPLDRQSRVLLRLLEAAPQSARSESLEAQLGVS